MMTNAVEKYKYVIIINFTVIDTERIMYTLHYITYITCARHVNVTKCWKKKKKQRDNCHFILEISP